jgi:hypothetical protein
MSVNRQCVYLKIERSPLGVSLGKDAVLMPQLLKRDVLKKLKERNTKRQYPFEKPHPNEIQFPLFTSAAESATPFISHNMG